MSFKEELERFRDELARGVEELKAKAVAEWASECDMSQETWLRHFEAVARVEANQPSDGPHVIRFDITPRPRLMAFEVVKP